MNEFFSEIWQKLKKFWKINIEKNYKRISIAFGLILVMIADFIFMRKLAAIYPDAEDIFYALYLFLTAVALSIFGQKEDGNGYDIPPQEQLEVAFKRNPEWRKIFEKEYKDYLLEQELLKREFGKNKKNHLVPKNCKNRDS